MGARNELPSRGTSRPYLAPDRLRGVTGNMRPESDKGFRCEETRWRAGTQGPAPLRGSLTLPGMSAWREALTWLSTLAPELAEGAVFLDIETTGLGHTAATLAFVVGLARVVGGAVEVEQFVLEKLSGEPGMLAALVGRLPPGGLLVTFNGASFDLPVLRGRLRRCGLEAGALAGPHLDLLPLARRLWRGRGPDCRLATLERLQLGVSREGDLPGHAIPAMFWAALREPRAGAEGIRQVVAHNLADMLAMPALALALARTIARPTDLDLALRVCDHLNAIGRRGPALAALAPWVAPLVAVDRPGAVDLAGQLRERRALLRAAELHRREGRADAAACLWEAVCWRFPGDKAAHAALSRDLERRRGDPAGALAVLAASEAPCPRRLARLQRMVQPAGPFREGRGAT
jgi:uncharacterized protein YprB with RNaseH-like and TPR domain